jgi:hypothetical protein
MDARVKVTPRVENGILCEDAFHASIELPGGRSLSFVKGAERVEQEAPLKSYEAFADEVRVASGFDSRVDKWIELPDREQKSYRLDETTQRFHMVYTYLLYRGALGEYFYFKVDAHLGVWNAYFPARTEIGPSGTNGDLDVNVTSRIFKRGPGTPLVSIPLSDVSVLFESENSTKLGKTGKNGNLNIPSGAHSLLLRFDNDHFRLGTPLRPNKVLPLAPAETRMSLAYVGSAGLDVSDRVPMSYSLPFYFLNQTYTEVLQTVGQLPLSYPLPVVVNYQKPPSDCNAFFGYEIRNSQGEIERPAHLAFYDATPFKCLNAGHFGDIVLHEMGHYLDFRFGGIQDAASSEGFGDIMALLFHRYPILAEGFKTSHPLNSHIRDLRIQRYLPAHEGEVHFEGQIVASAVWNLISQWRLLYSEDWVYQTLKDVFLKSLTLASTMQDIPTLFWHLLSSPEDPSSPGPNHLQCSSYAVFNQHGLTSRRDACERRKPVIWISIPEDQFRRDADGRQYLATGSEIQPTITLVNRGGLVSSGYLATSIWMDDKLLDKQTLSLNLVPGTQQVSSRLRLPVTASKNHRYSLRVAISDERSMFHVSEKRLPLDRVFVGYGVDSLSSQQMVEGFASFPIQFDPVGFVEDEVSVQISLRSTRDSEKVTTYLIGQDGRRERVLAGPPSLREASKYWTRIRHRFQGLPAQSFGELVIQLGSVLGQSVWLDTFMVYAPIYREVDDNHTNLVKD